MYNNTYNKKSNKMHQKNLITEKTSFLTTPKGQPVYTANLTIETSMMTVEVLNPSNPKPIEFKQDPEGISAILKLFANENIKGVRLIGKKKNCQLLAETFVKQGIRPLISCSKKSQNMAVKGIPVLQDRVAGIDIGKSVIYVAVPPHLDEDHTRVFGTFSEDLNAIVAWLNGRGIKEVAMESTSVYWVPLYELCEKNGIKPILINPKHVKILPGRKTDVLDSQWLMRLLACGLLQAGFIPPQPIRDMRDLARYRQDLMDKGGDCLNVVHKMLSLMNIQLSNVISDISGKSGMAIIKAIAQGERDPSKLADLVDQRCRCTMEELLKALHGTYNEAQIFIMNKELERYEDLHTKIIEIELKIKELLERLPDRNTSPLPKRDKRSREKKEYNRSPYCFDMRSLLYRKFGFNLTVISGIEESSAAIITFEIGGNVDAFPTNKHFASWDGTAPGNKISGGKMLSGKAPKKFSRVGQVLRIAANANHKADSATGAYMRRLMRNGKSKKAARKATAHRLSTQVYNLIKFGQPYVEKGAADYEKTHEERKIKSMTKALKELGYNVIKKEEVI